MPTPQRKIKYLTKQELEKLFAKIQDQRDKALFATIYYYGLRVSEATLLMLDDIDLERNIIYIHRVKGGISGEKPLFKSLKKLIQSYLEVRNPKGDALFTGRQGNLKVGRIQQLFKRYLKEANLNSSYGVHCLRHSIATHLVEAGQDIHFVQDHLGHANIENTLIYARMTNKRREEVFRELESSSELVKI
jgi:site-specific recombinase XerD